MENPFTKREARSEEEQTVIDEELDVLEVMYSEWEQMLEGEHKEKALEHLHCAGMYLQECNIKQAQEQETEAQEEIDEDTPNP